MEVVQEYGKELASVGTTIRFPTHEVVIEAAHLKHGVQHYEVYVMRRDGQSFLSERIGNNWLKAGIPDDKWERSINRF